MRICANLDLMTKGYMVGYTRMIVDYIVIINHVKMIDHDSLTYMYIMPYDAVVADHGKKMRISIMQEFYYLGLESNVAHATDKLMRLKPLIRHQIQLFK